MIFLGKNIFDVAFGWWGSKANFKQETQRKNIIKYPREEKTSSNNEFINKPKEEKHHQTTKIHQTKDPKKKSIRLELHRRCLRHSWVRKIWVHIGVSDLGFLIFCSCICLWFVVPTCFFWFVGYSFVFLFWCSSCFCSSVLMCVCVFFFFWETLLMCFVTSLWNSSL